MKTGNKTFNIKGRTLEAILTTKLFGEHIDK